MANGPTLEKHVISRTQGQGIDLIQRMKATLRAPLPGVAIDGIGAPGTCLLRMGDRGRHAEQERRNQGDMQRNAHNANATVSRKELPHR